MSNICAYDEAFTKKEMLEETSHCNECRLACEYSKSFRKAYTMNGEQVDGDILVIRAVFDKDTGNLTIEE